MELKKVKNNKNQDQKPFGSITQSQKNDENTVTISNNHTGNFFVTFKKY